MVLGSSDSEDAPTAPSAHSSSANLRVGSVDDRRRPAHGWSRLLVVALAVLGLVILCPAAVRLIRSPDQAPVLESLNVAAGAVYLLLSVCVAHNGRRMRMIGWMSLTALLTGAVLFGLLTWGAVIPELEPSVWYGGGRGLGYLPLVAPVLAGIWMWMSDPRRIVVNAERLEETRSAWRG